MQRQSTSDLIRNASCYTVLKALVFDGDRDLGWEYNNCPPLPTPPPYRGKLINTGRAM